MNCVIVDSNITTVNILEQYLKNFDGFNIVGKASSGIDALKLLEDKSINLMFINIDLPDINGFDLVKLLINKPEIILLSESSENAIKGFDVDAIDFLVKPISLERFAKSLIKYKTKIQKSIHDTTNKSQTIKLELNTKTYFLQLDDILYIESMREFIKIHLKEEEPIILKYVLGKLEELLPQDNFIRVHKSYICAINKIRTYSSKFLEINEKKIPIGLTYKNSTLKSLI